jgi:glycine C-acetyltransferase/8-amino-7-oxononanoate synthase
MKSATGAFLAEELQELQAKGLYRKLKTLSRGRGTRAVWEGKEVILFCGNDYLGLSQHPSVVGAAREALDQYGAGAGAARLISGTSSLHTELEKELASFKQKERALVFGAGYLANLGVLGALAGEKDLIVMDKLSHASLIDGAKLSQATLRVFPHRNYEQCEKILEKADGFRRRMLVSDSVFSMDGDLADLSALVRLKEKYDCLLVVDDAHGIGIFGSEGRGVTEGWEEKIDAIVGTLSKALGVFGGFVAADEIFVERMINFSRSFIFATAPPPALAAAALEALRLIREVPKLRATLWQNVDRVRSVFAQKGFSLGERSPIVPLLIGEEAEAVRISEALLERGILIPAVRYPAVPKGKARLRVTVSADHREEDFEKLFKALSQVLG